MAEEPPGRGLGQLVSAAILNPPRTALVLTLETAVLVARAARRVADRAADEGERQLARLNEPLGRSAQPRRRPRGGNAPAIGNLVSSIASRLKDLVGPGGPSESPPSKHDDA